MEPIITTGAALVGAGAWFGDKLLGPTVGILGDKMKDVFQKGADKIVQKGIEKTLNLDDGGKTNLRVTRDVFLNGSFSEEDINAEYFGGILASSRSEDGKDDGGIYFLDIIKSLSSSQLKLHYYIYNSIQRLIKNKPDLKDINPGLNTEVNKLKLFFSSIECEHLGCKTDIDLNVLFSKGVISQYKSDSKNMENGKSFPYFEITPTTLGIQLFMIANNKLNQWRDYCIIDVQNFKDIKLPVIYDNNLDDLILKINQLGK